MNQNKYCGNCKEFKRIKDTSFGYCKKNKITVIEDSYCGGWH